MDHRLAFLGLVGLLIGAAVPLAYAWARLLPEEPPPFPIEPGSFPSVDEEAVPEASRKSMWESVVSIILLICLTLAFAIRVPGFPSGLTTRWLDAVVTASTRHWLLLAGHIFLLVACVAAGAYAALRPGPLRTPLLAAAVLVLLLWFLEPILQLAMLGNS